MEGLAKTMASPHASSFICLPFSDHPNILDAYTVYFSVCIGSALIGVVGALLFLAQVLRQGKDPYFGGAPSSQRCILVLLAVSDVMADLGKYISARSVRYSIPARRIFRIADKNSNKDIHTVKCISMFIYAFCW